MSDTVKIGDREFRIGATYQTLLTSDAPYRLLYLIGVEPCHGLTLLKYCEGGKPNDCHKVHEVSPQLWLRWAGDEVLP